MGKLESERTRLDSSDRLHATPRRRRSQRAGTDAENRTRHFLFLGLRSESKVSRLMTLRCRCRSRELGKLSGVGQATIAASSRARSAATLCAPAILCRPHGQATSVNARRLRKTSCSAAAITRNISSVTSRRMALASRPARSAPARARARRRHQSRGTAKTAGIIGVASGRTGPTTLRLNLAARVIGISPRTVCSEHWNSGRIYGAANSLQVSTPAAFIAGCCSATPHT